MSHRRCRAADFGPLAFEAVWLAMIAAGRSRPGINARVARIRRMIRWAIARQLLKPDLLVALHAVDPLKAGRTTAPETVPIGPVPDEHVDTVLPYLTPPLRAAVATLRLGGQWTLESTVRALSRHSIAANGA